eukprot:TRINITY_DN777_c0_g2_i1.p1 TRINITY_DN777_c0_g2~~TRINITY_DN777_c0_g2_i1.p1  ORF type:complete len:1257 (-),score=310.59 TRINITY_DN777_c0_g2_i1:2230-6000(-)
MRNIMDKHKAQVIVTPFSSTQERHQRLHSIQQERRNISRPGSLQASSLEPGHATCESPEHKPSKSVGSSPLVGRQSGSRRGTADVVISQETVRARDLNQRRRPQAQEGESATDDSEIGIQRNVSTLGGGELKHAGLPTLAPHTSTMSGTHHRQTTSTTADTLAAAVMALIDEAEDEGDIFTDFSSTDVKIPLELALSFMSESNLRHLISIVDSGHTEVRPSHHMKPMCLMFADISGFTALTETLTREGGVGLELLTSHLNAYFGDIIDIISSSGGDIVQFAGDALIAVWRANHREALKEEIAKTVNAAMTIQNAMSGYVTEAGFPLSLHVNIGAGDISMLNLGGVGDQFVFLMAGDPFQQVGRAEDEAPPGSVHLSMEACSLVDESKIAGTLVAVEGSAGAKQAVPTANDPMLNWEGVTAGAADLAPVHAEATSDMYRDIIEKLAQRYLSNTILARLSGGASAWIGELRFLTVLFINLPGLDYSTKDLLGRMQAIVSAVQETVQFFEGTVNKMLMDDKGTTILIAFGLPPLAHKHDAVRGVDAALQIREKLGNLDPPQACACGVTSGRAFCGSYGSSVRQEYAIMGDTVNLSARLMQHAKRVDNPLSIVCCSQTQSYARDHFDFQALEPLRLKGKAQLIPAFTVTSFRHSRRAQHVNITPLCGRQTEMAVIKSKLATIASAVTRGWDSKRDLLSTVAGGRRRLSGSGLVITESADVMLFRGIPGAGRTRLLEEAVRSCDAAGIRSVFVAGDPIERSTPFYAFREMILDILGVNQFPAVHTPKGEEELVQIIKRFDDKELSLFSPLCGAFFGINVPLKPHIAGLIPNPNDLGYYATRWFVRLLQLVARDAEHGVVLAIDDAHLLDNDSLRLLEIAVINVPEMQVIMSAEADATTRLNDSMSYLTISKSPHFAMYTLSGLSFDDSKQLFCVLANAREIKSTLFADLYSRLEGNPYFIESLVKVLLTQGLLSVDEDGNALLQDLGDQVTGLPESLQGAITARVDALSQQMQMTLKVCSICPHNGINPRLVAAVHPNDARPDDVWADLEALCGLGFLKHRPSNSFVSGSDPPRAPAVPKTAPAVPVPFASGVTEIPEADLEQVYLFKHSTTQVVVYELLLYSQRRQLHQAVAEWYEETYKEDLVPYYTLLAGQYADAGIDEKSDYYHAKAVAVKNWNDVLSATGAVRKLVHMQSQKSLQANNDGDVPEGRVKPTGLRLGQGAQGLSRSAAVLPGINALDMGDTRANLGGSMALASKSVQE